MGFWEWFFVACGFGWLLLEVHSLREAIIRCDRRRIASAEELSVQIDEVGRMGRR